MPAIARMKTAFWAKASADKKTYEIQMYGDVGGGWFGDGITDTMVKGALDRAPVGAKVILRVNSYGGEAWQGLAIKNVLATHEAYVEAHIDGLAASAMATAVMGANKIVMHEGSALMIHEAASVTRGTMRDHQETMQALETLNDGMASAYARKMGTAKADARALMAAESYFTPEQALANGLADVADPMRVNGAMARMTASVAKLFGYQAPPDWIIAEDEPAEDDDPAEDVPEAAVVPYQAYPVKDSGSWDAGAAKGRIKAWAAGAGGKIDWAKYRKAFAWYDASKADTEGAYKLPHHDVVNGSLVSVRAGVIAAGNAVSGARGGTDIPAGELPGVRGHLEKEYALHKMTAPWKKKAQLEDPTEDEPALEPSTEESTMNKKLLAQLLGISESASDEAFEAAIQAQGVALASARTDATKATSDAASAVASARAETATARGIITRFETALGETGDEAFGALDAHLARSKQLDGVNAQLAEQAQKADDVLRASLLKQATDERKWTKAEIDGYWNAKGDDGKYLRSTGEMAANLKYASPKVAALAHTPPALTLVPGAEAPKHEGKTYAELSGPERAALKESDPTLFAAMRAHFQSAPKTATARRAADLI